MKLDPNKRLLHALPPHQPQPRPLPLLNLPRLKNRLHILDPPYLLNPHPNILPPRIIVEPLLNRVESPRLPRIIPNTSIILPIAPIAANIIICQQGLVPFGAEAPVDAQVLREEGGDVLAQPVGRVAREEELAHAGVDEAVARRAFEEAPHGVLRRRVAGGGVFPGFGGVVFKAGDLEEARAEFAGYEAEVVPPEELEADGGGALRGVVSGC